MAPQRPPQRGNQPPRGPQARKSSGPPPRRDPAPKRPSPPSRAPKGRPGDLVGADRLQKLLAHAGIGSRRACEELIVQGRVTVDGAVVRELGTKVDPARMVVALDGQRIHQEKPVYFAVYKPKGYVSTNNDPSGRPRVLDLLPEIPQRVYTVGRLDEMSVGLMILTNDGELANKLAHPRFGVEKLYRVIVAGLPTREVLKQLTDGIWLAEGKVRAKSVRAVARKGEATILEMVLAEGKNREVRRMLAKLGHKVMMLTRVAVGPITVKGLTAGQFRPLTGREVDLLRRVAAGEPVPMPWMQDRKTARPLPDRPRRGASDAPPERRAGPPSQQAGGGRPARDSRPGTSSGPPRRPDAPRSYQDGPPRRPGPRPDGGGPPRRPTEFRANQAGGPPRHPEGPGGPSRRRGDYQSNQGGPPRDGNGYRPGASSGPPRRPEGPRSDQDGPPQRRGDYQSNQGGPPARAGAGYRQGPGGPPRRPEGPGGSGGHDSRPPRPSAGPPRPPQGQGNGRPSNRPGDDRRPGQRPPAPPRRSSPPTGDQPRRRVIGMEPQQSAPTPPPPQVQAQPRSEGRDDRPKPRMKRPPGKRPAPRPGSRPMPKRRRGGDSAD